MRTFEVIAAASLSLLFACASPAAHDGHDDGAASSDAVSSSSSDAPVDCSNGGDKVCPAGSEGCFFVYTDQSYGCYADVGSIDATNAHAGQQGPVGGGASCQDDADCTRISSSLSCQSSTCQPASSSSSGSSFGSGFFAGACMGACSSNYANDPSGLSACNYQCAVASGSN